MNASMIMTNQNFLNLKSYLENAKPVIAETKVCASASPAAHRIVFLNVEPSFSKFAASFRFPSEKLLGSQLTDGSMMSSEDMKVFAMISKIGSRYTKPTQISTK